MEKENGGRNTHMHTHTCTMGMQRQRKGDHLQVREVALGSSQFCQYTVLGSLASRTVMGHHAAWIK